MCYRSKLSIHNKLYCSLVLCLSFRLFCFREKSFGKLCVVQMLVIIHLCFKIDFSAYTTLPSTLKPEMYELQQKGSQAFVFWLGSNNVELHEKLEGETAKWGQGICSFVFFWLSSSMFMSWQLSSNKGSSLLILSILMAQFSHLSLAPVNILSLVSWSCLVLNFEN